MFWKSKKKTTVIVDGVSYTGKHVVIEDGIVTIDGDNKTQKIGHIVHVEIQGDCDQIYNAAGNISVSGNAKKVETASGDVECGDVSGDVKSMSGDITCGNVAGSIQTMSGDVKIRK